MSIQSFPETGILKSDRDSALADTLIGLAEYVRQRIEAFRHYRALRKAWRIDRQAFQNVLYLDDRILDDMGVTREDVLWANKLPLSRNAARELHNRSRAGRHAVHRRAAKKFR